MAKVLFGAGYQLIGSIGGTTFQRSRYGAVARIKTSPVQPNTPAQMAFRNRVTGAATAWKALTQVARESWNNLAAAFPVTDSFGNAITLTGQAFFNRAAIDCATVGKLPPSPTSVDTWLVPSITNVNIEATGDGSGDITVTAAAIEQLLGTYFILQATPPQGVRNSGTVKNQFRTILGAPVADFVEADIEEAYNARFNAKLGDTIWFRVKMVTHSIGSSSPWFVLPPVEVVAP